MTLDEEYMEKALVLAQKAAEHGEVPVGAIVVDENGEIIGEGYNRREELQSPTAHAEIIAIEQAAKRLHNRRLSDCTLYVTLEPCPMCAGAIINARIKTLVFGAYDSRAGSIDSVINLCDYPYNHKPEIYGGICEDECTAVLQDFFKNLR